MWRLWLVIAQEWKPTIIRLIQGLKESPKIVVDFIKLTTFIKTRIPD